MLWSLDESAPTACWSSSYPYFETAEPTVWDEGDGHLRRDRRRLREDITHEWNHGLGETVTALLDAGMEITMLEEHDTVPWDALPGQMVDTGGGELPRRDRPRAAARTYTIQARKR